MVCAPFDGDVTFFEKLSLERLGLGLARAGTHAHLSCAGPRGGLSLRVL